MGKAGLIILFAIVYFHIALPVRAGEKNKTTAIREHISMDADWRFAYGHPYDAEKDYNHATSYFSYFAKTGYGDGPASPTFDDRPWRILDIPHDWAVEQPFDPKGSHSHGYKAIGRNFPDASVGWYRKTFQIPQEDLGKRISIEFDGVHRDAIVWINGFYMGRESSGYSNFKYDITDYLNYGSDNVIAVRVDVTIEEGWFYEGAGIYRHVWLTKTDPLHVDYNGTFVTSEIDGSDADVEAVTTIVNENTSSAEFEIQQQIIDASGSTVASEDLDDLNLAPGANKDIRMEMEVENPKLWSIETPYLYTLITTIKKKNEIVDHYETSFGIRTIRFDPDEGFFLNGQHVKIKGTNNHQDHAGVGTAIPDALQEFRIVRLKEMGSNAYRCSHNPPTPELLDACDRLGMLVLDENRLLGTSPELLDRLERMIKRDRNHPSVILWSLGNEEWAVEGNIKGARIAASLQDFAKRLDSTRPYTVASSGGWDHGVSTVTEVMGYNYIKHGNTDEHHKQFPNQPGVGTEESTTQGTRGIYFDDRENGHMRPTNRNPKGPSAEEGWKYYAKRPYLSGLFYWTGFDYRGEPNPLAYPAVSSQYGILDLCGFPKESWYYLKSWWIEEPYLQITPHWNWLGKEGQQMDVFVYSNSDEVELFLNDSSLGKKLMEPNGHLQWDVAYQPGTLLARGYKNNKQIITGKVETTGPAKSIQLSADRYEIKADGDDVSVIAIQLNDDKDRYVPVADNALTFSIDGPGKIIGVGNGDPASHEPDNFIKGYVYPVIENLKVAAVESAVDRPEVKPDFDDSGWMKFKYQRDQIIFKPDTIIVIRGNFDLPEFDDQAEITLFSKSLSMDQAIYINGNLIAEGIKREAQGQEFVIDHSILKKGRNIYAIVGPPLVKRNQWEELNTDPGLVRVVTPAPAWKRSAFNGLAQVIVQSTQKPGDIILFAISPGLQQGQIRIRTE